MRCSALEERRVPFNASKRKGSGDGGEGKDEEAGCLTDELIYGGDILGDIDAILHMQAKGWPYILEYKEGFEKEYGISFVDALEKAPRLPVYIVRVFTIRGTIREFDSWQTSDMKEKKKAINGLIDEISEAVLQTDKDKLQEVFETEEMSTKADKIEQLCKVKREALKEEADN